MITVPPGVPFGPATGAVTASITSTGVLIGGRSIGLSGFFSSCAGATAGTASSMAVMRVGRRRRVIRSGAFAGRMEADLIPLLLDIGEFPCVPGHEDRGAIAVIGNGAAILVDELVQIFGSLAGNPAGRLIGSVLEADLEAVD